MPVYSRLDHPMAPRAAATLDLEPCPRQGDALIVVDVQRDFLPGGALAVPHGDEVVPVLNQYIERFAAAGVAPIAYTRDWHPENHCSFVARGGPWPQHCVAGTPGAEFATDLQVTAEAWIVSKATQPDQEAHSGFDRTALDGRLDAAHVTRVFVGGLATEWCVRATVEDALASGFEVGVLTDAIRAIDPAAGDAAVEEMRAAGAVPITLAELAA
jgi:nicotinamidase/pyrazinamidase